MIFKGVPAASLRGTPTITVERLLAAPSRLRGFTQVELIVAIVIAGVLAATVFPRWDGTTGFEERGFRDSIVSGLRHAQKSAVAAHRRTCVTFSSTTATFSIAANFLDANCAAGTPLVGPDGVNLVVTATGKAKFSSVPGNIVFDAAGRPVTGAVTLVFIDLPASLNVVVEAETGYVR